MYFIALAAFLCITGPLQAQKKSDKTAKNEQIFQETLALVESNQFKIDINRVYPQRGYDLSRFNPRGIINIKDSIAEGNLPFFGRAYSLPYGEGGGLEFDNKMEDRSVKINDKKKGKSISYDFSVRSQNDVLSFRIEIHGGGGCTVNLLSNNRESITYSGNITPLSEEKKK